VRKNRCTTPQFIASHDPLNSLPGHHEIKDLVAGNQPQLWNIKESWKNIRQFERAGARNSLRAIENCCELPAETTDRKPGTGLLDCSSRSDGLEGISGSMEIKIDNGKHYFEFACALPCAAPWAWACAIG
jgi:hypothetical protein